MLVHFAFELLLFFSALLWDERDLRVTFGSVDLDKGARGEACEPSYCGEL